MTFILLLPTIVSFLVLAAHFLRGGSLLLVVASLALSLLLLVRRSWAVKTTQVVLILAAIEWVFTAQAVIQARIEEDRDWHRSAIILLSVAAFNLFAAALFQTRTLRTRYARPTLAQTHASRTLEEAHAT
jgi:hypothetical protein